VFLFPQRRCLLPQQAFCALWALFSLLLLLLLFVFSASFYVTKNALKH
jgi:hypothetical protein